MSSLSRSAEVFLNLRNRMLGQILIHLGNYPLLHIHMKSMAQLRKGARRSNNDERLHAFCSNQFLYRSGYVLYKAMLLQLMPICDFHAAAAVRGSTLKCPPGPIGPLLMGRRIFVSEDVFGDQFGYFTSPVLRRNSAFCPSPTNTTASWGIESLFMFPSRCGSPSGE